MLEAYKNWIEYQPKDPRIEVFFDEYIGCYGSNMALKNMFRDMCYLAYGYEGVLNVLEFLLQKLGEPMDKKMAKVTKQMKTAERDIKKGDKKGAVKALKGAEKKNVKLTKIDRTVRDPEIKAYKKMKKKGC